MQHSARSTSCDATNPSNKESGRARLDGLVLRPSSAQVSVVLIIPFCSGFHERLDVADCDAEGQRLQKDDPEWENEEI